MKNTKIIFLRHADTQKDPLINAALWSLSDVGTIQAEENANRSIMKEVDVIYVSEELKTKLTIEPLAKKINKKPIVSAAFNEVKRGDKFLTKEEFELEKDKQLIDPNFCAFGGESGIEAIARFKKGVEEASFKNSGKTILIVTHGTVLNFYFADLLGVQELLPERWRQTKFCAYGIIEEGKVIKDIIND